MSRIKYQVCPAMKEWHNICKEHQGSLLSEQWMGDHLTEVYMHPFVSERTITFVFYLEDMYECYSDLI